MSHDISFLERLLDAAGPSGFEVRAARVWREDAETFADTVDTDVTGNSFAVLNPSGSPRVMLAVQIPIRLGDAKLHEKRLAHLWVVVLPRMYQQRLDAADATERGNDRGDLHQVGPGPANAEDFEHHDLLSTRQPAL